MAVTNLTDLSEIDHQTIYLRGASGWFKPENDREALIVREALAAGASDKLEIAIIEYAELRRQSDGVKFRFSVQLSEAGF